MGRRTNVPPLTTSAWTPGQVGWSSIVAAEVGPLLVESVSQTTVTAHVSSIMMDSVLASAALLSGPLAVESVSQTMTSARRTNVAPLTTSAWTPSQVGRSSTVAAEVGPLLVESVSQTTVSARRTSVAPLTASAWPPRSGSSEAQ